MYEERRVGSEGGRRRRWQSVSFHAADALPEPTASMLGQKMDKTDGHVAGSRAGGGCRAVGCDELCRSSACLYGYPRL